MELCPSKLCLPHIKVIPVIKVTRPTVTAEKKVIVVLISDHSWRLQCACVDLLYDVLAVKCNF